MGLGMVITAGSIGSSYSSSRLSSSSPPAMVMVQTIRFLPVRSLSLRSRFRFAEWPLMSRHQRIHVS